jgi:hypothetical protein
MFKQSAFKQSATNGNQSAEPPLMEPGELPDSERSKQPPLPESPYRPYSEEPAADEAPYEPYKGI